MPLKGIMLVEVAVAPIAAVVPITLTPLPGMVAAPSTITAEPTPLAAAEELPAPATDGAAPDAVLLELAPLEAGLLEVALAKAGPLSVLRTPPTGVGAELGALATTGAEVDPSPVTMAVPLLGAVAFGNPFTLEPRALSMPPISLPLAGSTKVLTPLPEAAVFEVLGL
jgi:hypothetical protein